MPRHALSVRHASQQNKLDRGARARHRSGGCTDRRLQAQPRRQLEGSTAQHHRLRAGIAPARDRPKLTIEESMLSLGHHSRARCKCGSPLKAWNPSGSQPRRGDELARKQHVSWRPIPTARGRRATVERCFASRLAVENCRRHVGCLSP
jgi:hypothetical protein